MKTVVQVSRLTKAYNAVVAVDDVSFEITRGEIFGILGPNGAGKTTTIEIMEGLRKPDKGNVAVLGMNPHDGKAEFKEAIGVQLQRTAIFRKLKVWEVLKFFGNLFQKRVPTDDLIEMFQLAARKDSLVRNLSGGEMQRLSVALAFVNDPQILFLDEPTTGMDPQARRDMWNVFERTRQQGKTLLLTTHYMEEAERLCDRVAILDLGRIIALDTPRGLMGMIDAEKRIEFRTTTKVDLTFLETMEGVELGECNNGVTILRSKTPERVLSKVFEIAAVRGFQVEGLRLMNPNLEDVYLKLTGKRLKDEDGTKRSGHRNETFPA
ncbi:MAG: ABC transporter ATP-binding protein [Ignavibacteria bacterium]|nr:ABC transporter ATP-binding protein [Ignavibacteria bacterium]